jgi:hypothetical protein
MGFHTFLQKLWNQCKNKVIYWCVAYLPSEASIIEHWTYTFHYQISYTFIKQCETLKIN